MNTNLLAAAVGLAGFFAPSYSAPSAALYAQAPSQTAKQVSSKPVADVATTPKVAQVEQPITVVVQPGDSLSSIAAAQQTTYVRLYNANSFIEQPDVINPGDVIRIPKPDEVLPERALPEATVVTAAVPVTVQAKPIAMASVGTNAGVWDQLARCESGGNWAINTGNGFYGGLQFTLATWAGVGGTGYPNQASREEQIARGQILQARSGWGQWPACTAKLGLR